MKGLFLIFIALLQICAYPQNVKPDFAQPDSNPYSLKDNEQKLFNKKLNKHLLQNRMEHKSGNPIYLPSEIVVDSSKKYIRTYDKKGNLITQNEEKIQDGSWIKVFRSTYNYDSKGNLLTETLFIWANTYWKKYLRHIYTYDSNDNKTSYNYEAFLDTSWVRSFRELYTYDNTGRLLSHYSQRLSNNNWMDFYRENWNYDGNRCETLVIEHFLDGTWVNNSKITKTFDSTGNEISFLQERWQHETWENSYSSVYTYDSLGNRVSEIHEAWEYGIFSYRDRHTNTYDNNRNCISTLIESWRDSTFVKSWLITRTYDEASNPLVILTQLPGSSSWENAYKIFYTYDNNGNAVKGESFCWQGGKWVSSSYEEFDLSYNKGMDHMKFWGGFVEVKFELLPEEDPSTIREITLLQNYPNPFNPSTAINYAIKRDGSVKLAVYDVLGKLVAIVVDEYRPAGSYSVNFDGSGLPSGVYIYRLEAGGYTVSKKFILMK